MPTETTYQELPNSATVRVITPAGYQWEVTTRSVEMQEVLNRIGVMESYFIEHNWQPATSGQTAAVQVIGPASANGSNGHGPKHCPHHPDTDLKPSRFGGLFCPAKVSESNGLDGKPLYCTYTTK